jgi:hypothetical protein
MNKHRFLMKSKYFVIVGILFFIFSLSLLVIIVRQKQPIQSNAAAPGPLRVHPTNPRYFTDGSGKAVYLTGSHTWSNLQDLSSTPFDYHAYLDMLQRSNHNFIRLWSWEVARRDYDYESGPADVNPVYFARTGQGTALDGKPKFDLNSFNQTYFDRLRARIVAARDRGMYVSIMLFEGHELHSSEPPWRWNGHPFNAANNVNGVDGNPNGDGYGTEVHTLAVPAVTLFQKAYVRKVIDTVNDLDNVLYEISNESGGDSTSWQYEMIRYIQDYEGGRIDGVARKRHPVGMTFQWSSLGSGTNANLWSSPADWVSPGQDGTDDYFGNPPPADGRKIILADTDHINASTEDPAWVWRSFLRGLNAIVMDHFHGDRWGPIRWAMGDARRYADKMNLAAMTPQGNLSSTGYTLANPGAEYLAYQPGSGSFSVTLGLGTYAIEWFNPATRQTSAGGTVNGGGSSTFTPPFDGQAVLYLAFQPQLGQHNPLIFRCLYVCQASWPKALVSAKLATVHFPAFDVPVAVEGIFHCPFCAF